MITFGTNPLVYLGMSWIAFHAAQAYYDVRRIIHSRKNKLIRIGHQPTVIQGRG